MLQELIRNNKIQTIADLYEAITDEEVIIVDVLRQIINDTLPEYCKEKISYHVPYFYGNRGICIIWPSSIPNGGIEEGVLLGFWQGNKLRDKNNYLTKGTNKKIFYKVFKKPEDINPEAIIELLEETLKIDQEY